MGKGRRWRGLVVAVLVAGALLAIPQVGGAKGVGFGLGLYGGKLSKQEACGGKARSVMVVAVGSTAKVTLIEGRQRRKATLSIERCHAGKWVSPKRIKLARNKRRHIRRLDTSVDGDFRLRAVSGKARRTVYLRVGRGSPVDVAVTFKVKNVNTSGVSCASDGKDYKVKGHLVAPPAGRAVTLYLHGLSLGEWFWRFGAVPGYDLPTEMVKSGHASVVIDRLGYDTSDRPPGDDVCVGSQADMAHQIVGKLRKGDYEVSTGKPVAFSKVALAGHSAGGAIAQVAAYSFKDVDALAVLAYADQGSSQRAQSEFATTSTVCATGGDSVDESGAPPEEDEEENPTGVDLVGDGDPATRFAARQQETAAPGGYAHFGQDPEDFQAAMFADADPKVVTAATALRNRNPCGDTNSIVPAIVVNQQRLDEVTVPVLLLYGERDALYPPASGASQKNRYTGSKDVTLSTLAGTGHALALERSAPKLRSELSAWLKARGF